MARAFSPTATHVRLVGAASLDKLLEGLPKKVANKILRDALRKAGKIVQAEAKARAPVDEGELKRSITVRKGKRKRKGSQSVVIFPDQNKFKDDFHGPYVEYGTSDTPAQPFMRPAFEATKDQALAIVRSDVIAGVQSARANGTK